MSRIKLIGVTDYAERHLDKSLLDDLKSMINAYVSESNEVADIDGGKLFYLPDGEQWHIDFLILETE